MPSEADYLVVVQLGGDNKAGTISIAATYFSVIVDLFRRIKHRSSM